MKMVIQFQFLVDYFCKDLYVCYSSVIYFSDDDY